MGSTPAIAVCVCVWGGGVREGHFWIQLPAPAPLSQPTPYYNFYIIISISTMMVITSWFDKGDNDTVIIIIVKMMMMIKEEKI